MSDAVPIAEAMEEAAAVLDAETLAVIEETAPIADGPCWCGLTHAPGVTHAQPPPDDEPLPVEASGPVQPELFPPPPGPPFDFEKAYEELERLDQRARNKKRAWEACKRDTKEAREEYDEALEDLHAGFTKVDAAKREAARRAQAQQPVLVPVQDAAPTTESPDGEAPQENVTTEGGEPQMSEGTETPEIEQPTPAEEPTPEPDAPND